MTARATTVAESGRESRPNFTKRRILGGLAVLGASGLMITGAFVAGRAAVRDIGSTLNHRANEVALARPFPEVEADLKAGKIDSTEVTEGTVPRNELAWDAAAELAGSDHATQPVSDILLAQLGSQLTKGEHFIVPNDDVDLPLGGR